MKNLIIFFFFITHRFDDLSPFHEKCPSDVNKFIWIANTVRKNISNPEYNLDDLVKNISKLINCTEKKVLASLKQYDVTKEYIVPKETDPLLNQLLNHDKASMYTVLKGYPKRIAPIYEISNQRTFSLSQAEICQKIYQCILGILTQHKGENNMYPIFTVHQNVYKELKITPHFPAIEVPPLENLIFREENDGLDTTRKQLLEWVFDFKVDKIMEIESKEYIPIILTLGYLVKHARISLRFADSFLLMFYKGIEKQIPREIKRPESLDFETFQAIWLYIQTQEMVMQLLTTVGFDHLTRYTAFDGYYFHEISVMIRIFDPIKNIQFYESLNNL